VITPSDTVPLGRSRVQVTRLGLGMHPLARLPIGKEAVGRDIVRAAARLGIGLFDTAPTYGYGESERRLGEQPRDLLASVVISTKVGRVLGPHTHRRPVGRILGETIAGGPVAMAGLTRKVARRLNGAVRRRPRRPDIPTSSLVDYSYDATLRSIEGSLERVGVDRFGIVFIHDPDDHLEAAMDGAYRALDRLRSDGTISAVGVSSNRWQPLVRVADEGSFDCFLLAGRYSLLDQSGLEALLPMAHARGISVIIGGPFNGGLLADPVGKPFFDYAPASHERIAQARALDQVCRRHGVSLKAAAVQFPFGHPAVSSVLVGASSVAEMEEDERLAGVPIPAALWEELRHEGMLAPEAPLPIDHGQAKPRDVTPPASISVTAIGMGQ
jgi:D-threo-aldose 1-dehydrogenase